MATTTRKQRSHHVMQMCANFAIEDSRPDCEDREMQKRYIDGEIGLSDMLKYAHDYAERCRPTNL